MFSRSLDEKNEENIFLFLWFSRIGLEASPLENSPILHVSLC